MCRCVSPQSCNIGNARAAYGEYGRAGKTRASVSAGGSGSCASTFTGASRLAATTAARAAPRSVS